MSRIWSIGALFVTSIPIYSLCAGLDDARLLRAAAKVSGKFLSKFGLARSDLTNTLGTHENNNS